MNNAEWLESTVIALETRLAALETERAEVSAQLLQARRALITAQREASAAASETRDLARLAELRFRLEGSIGRAPARSHTAAAARELLATFDADPSISTLERINRVRHCLNHFRRGLETVDPQIADKTPAHIPVGKIAL